MHKIKASTLRRAAESVSGTRDKDVFLVLRRDEFEQHDAEPRSPVNGTVLLCHTESQFPANARPQLEEITAIAKKGGDPAQTYNLKQYDAVFWSEAAIEKFLYPYYAALHGRAAPFHLLALRDIWEDADVFAIAHLPKSEPGAPTGTPMDGEGSHFRVLAEKDGQPVALTPEKFREQFRR